MNTFQLTGQLHEVGAEVTISDRFCKREFILECQDGSNREYIKFQLVQELTGLIDPYKLRDKVTVDFVPRGRGFNKNGQMLWFTQLEAQAIRPATLPQ